MDLKEYFLIIWRRKWVLILTTLITMLVATVGTLLMTPIYAATTTLRVAPVSGSSTEALGWDAIQYTDRLMSTYTNIILSDPVLDELAYKLGMEEAPRVTIEIPANTELMQITVESPEPRVAAVAADTVAEILMSQVRALVTTDGRVTREVLSEQLDQLDQEISAERAAFEALAAQMPEGSLEVEEARRRVESKEQVYGRLLEEFEQSRIHEAVRANTISVIMPATVPQKPSKPNKVLNVGVGALLGVVGGLALVFLFENLSFSSQPVAGSATGTPVRGGYRTGHPAYSRVSGGRFLSGPRWTKPVVALVSIFSLCALSLFWFELVLPKLQGESAAASTVAETPTVATTARARNGVTAQGTPEGDRAPIAGGEEDEGESVTDSGGAEPPEAALPGGELITLSLQVGQSSDDSEEQVADGTIFRSSGDLDLGNAGGQIGPQVAGVRFQNVTIPRGALISSAYLEFVANEIDEDEASLLIEGEAADNAATFNWGDYDLSSRARTTASVAWEDIPPWSALRARHRSPDLAPVIQEIVDREGWQSGNALVLLITGTGRRVAEAYDGDPALAPVLQVEFAMPP